VLQRVCAGGRYADCVTAVHVFGSYARGALEVGDIDIDIEYDSRLDREVERELVDRMMRSQDWNAPFSKALKPGTRAVQMLFNRVDMLAAAILIYERGDTLDVALARVNAIKADPAAGRAARDPMHPAIEPLAEDLARPSRILLTELAERGLIEIELVVLPDAELEAITNSNYRKALRLRWAATSPLARAARAAGWYLQDRGVDLDHVRLLGVSRVHADTPWAVECREHHLRSIVHDMGVHGVHESLFVVRPNLKRTMRVLRVTAADAPALTAIGDLDRWLHDHAPHIARIG
jgi:predicted nucleotidyltransferase